MKKYYYLCWDSTSKPTDEGYLRYHDAFLITSIVPLTDELIHEGEVLPYCGVGYRRESYDFKSEWTTYDTEYLHYSKQIRLSNPCILTYDYSDTTGIQKLEYKFDRLIQVFPRR